MPKKYKTYIRWTAEMDMVLAWCWQLRGKARSELLRECLPGIPRKSCEARAERSGIAPKRADRSMLAEIVAERYKTETAEAISADTGLPLTTIRNMGRRHGVQKQRSRPREVVLSEEQKAWLRRNYRSCTVGFVASFLGISKRTAVKLAIGMGLRKSLSERGRIISECKAYKSRKEGGERWAG